MHELLTDSSENLDITEMKQILIAVKNSTRSSARRLVYDVLGNLEAMSEERLDTANCINLLKLMGGITDGHQFSNMYRLNSRLLKILDTRIRSMSEVEILNLLDYYYKHP